MSLRSQQETGKVVICQIHVNETRINLIKSYNVIPMLYLAFRESAELEAVTRSNQA